jgi:hypothetical protein
MNDIHVLQFVSFIQMIKVKRDFEYIDEYKVNHEAN